MSRRRFCAALMLWPLAGRAALPAPSSPLRIGLTPVILDDQAAFLDAWCDDLAARLSRPIEFVQRGSYREIVELLDREKLDAAWLCGYPYVRNEQRLRLVAVPLHRGRPFYRSYLIVPAGDTRSRSLADLRGKVFAFSDPDSNSGHLYTRYSLARLQERPENFFARNFFTWSHRKVVEAVAVELAQGGAVDGYVWEALKRRHPELAARTRVVEQSPEFGFPPIVARVSLPQADYAALRGALLAMQADAAGRALLDQLDLTGFIAGSRGLFDGIARMARAVGDHP